MAAVELSKIIVIVINVVFMIFGIAALAAGIVFKVGWDEVRGAFVDEADKVDLNLQSAGDTLAIGAIVLGVFIILVSLLGLVGACCKVRCLLALYAIIVLVLLIAELAVIIYVAVKGNEAEEKIKMELTKVLNGYQENDSNAQSKAWSALFQTLKCCGINNYTDFEHRIDFVMAPERPSAYLKDNVPIACCRNFDYESKLTTTSFTSHASCFTDPQQNAYTTGCVQEIENRISNSKGVLIGVGVTILIIEILAILLAFFLCCRQED